MLIWKYRVTTYGVNRASRRREPILPSFLFITKSKLHPNFYGRITLVQQIAKHANGYMNL
jgi:hypothetical protein